MHWGRWPSFFLVGVWLGLLRLTLNTLHGGSVGQVKAQYVAPCEHVCTRVRARTHLVHEEVSHWLTMLSMDPCCPATAT